MTPSPLRQRLLDTLGKLSPQQIKAMHQRAAKRRGLVAAPANDNRGTK